MMKHVFQKLALAAGLLAFAPSTQAQSTLLLRQPTLSDTHIAFTYGGDLWVSPIGGGTALRLTSTPAVESNPHFSPDGKQIAFSSNRSGATAIYTVPVNGGDPTRLTWHPSAAISCGWTPDGSKILYATSRDMAPTPINRLWTVSVQGGPSTQLAAQWGFNGAYSPDGSQVVIEKISRWDVEWRDYRGGQNTPLIILSLKDLSETLIPCDRTTDIRPVWVGDKVYFLSDRDGVSNIWSYTPATKALKQLTTFTGADVKWLDGKGNRLAFEREGSLHLFDISTGKITDLSITATGDFPWAETKWEKVSDYVTSASLSPTGKRAIFEARGEIFTVPVEYGDVRNLTQSSDAADRAPIWSPKGDQVAWFSDAGGKGYKLMIAAQDGLSAPKSIDIGISKMAWEPTWSPDGKTIAFVDDDLRLQVIDLASGNLHTADVGGANIERGSQGLTWSTDSDWLAYAKSGKNNFRQVMVWSRKDKSVHALTDPFADSFSPAWDRDTKHLYFLASTDLALRSGWANTSSITARPEYAAYVINLRKEDPSPLAPRSDEESAAKPDAPEGSKAEAGKAETGKAEEKPKKKGDEKEEETPKPEEKKEVVIDFEGIARRTIALPLPEKEYEFMLAGPAGSVFIAENIPNKPGYSLLKFTLKEREGKEFVSGASFATISADGKQLLAKIGPGWKVMDASGPKGAEGKTLSMNLQMKLDRSAEWKQMFEETWRYERDYFYDPNLHGRDWNVVHERYAPLVPYLRHRADLNYVLDQVNGELSVGHSFVSGGDFPDTETNTIGLLGADLVAEKGRWKISRIYTTETWNPGLSSPLDRPGIKVQAGYYLVGINGKELTADQDPFQMLDGTAGIQTVLHLNDKPAFEGAWKEIVEPIRNETSLRQRVWVEDNRRVVDSLSGGKLGYVWIPNTGGPGFVSFNRYFFAQQDKQGAVIDERFNGGGLLDDYMVDLMTRSLRAAATNEVPNGEPFRLPAGILGPKVLLINEMAGSGGDFFPWVFRHQNAGPLIGASTWGGLVKSSVHYLLVDGGRVTAPDNAIFDPNKGEWIGENKGIAPDIEVRQDALSLSKGLDPQLQRAVKEVLLMLEKQGEIKVTPPPFPTPARH